MTRRKRPITTLRSLGWTPRPHCLTVLLHWVLLPRICFFTHACYYPSTAEPLADSGVLAVLDAQFWILLIAVPLVCVVFTLDSGTSRRIVTFVAIVLLVLALSNHILTNHILTNLRRLLCFICTGCTVAITALLSLLEANFVGASDGGDNAPGAFVSTVLFNGAGVFSVTPSGVVTLVLRCRRWSHFITPTWHCSTAQPGSSARRLCEECAVHALDPHQPQDPPRPRFHSQQLSFAPICG
jgi:hypothetical protein